jgi:hypothetical protein
VSLGALCSYRTAPTTLVRELLSTLGVNPVPGVQLREHALERTHKVYAAEAAEPIVSLLLSKDGVAIPVSNYDAPFRVATTLAAFAAKFRHANLYQLEQSLNQQHVGPIKLTDLGVPLENKEKVFGRLNPTVYEASVSESDQKRLVMADDKGVLLVFADKSIKDVERLYWIDQLEGALGKS